MAMEMSLARLLRPGEGRGWEAGRDPVACRKVGLRFEVSAKEDTWVKPNVPFLAGQSLVRTVAIGFQGDQLYSPDLNPPGGWRLVLSDLEAEIGQHFSARAQFPNAVSQSGMCFAGPTSLSTSPGLRRGKQTDLHVAFWSKYGPKGTLEFPSSFLIG